MARYIVHIGTGTVIDLNDEVYVVDGEDIEGDIDTEQDMIDAAIGRGTNIINLLRSHEWMSMSVTYAPDAIRTEVRESSFDFPETVKNWVANASDSDLLFVSELCMNDDRTWENFHPVMADAIFDVMAERDH